MWDVTNNKQTGDVRLRIDATAGRLAITITFAASEARDLAADLAENAALASVEHAEDEAHDD